MPRVTPPDRLAKLLDAAAAAFVEHGFHRTQMDDVAKRLGVSKGTIYRAVASKEELFAAVVAWADHPDHIPPTGLPSPIDLGEVAAPVTADLAHAIATLELTAIVSQRRRLHTIASVSEEVERIASDLYRVMHSRRIAIMVLDRCAGEIPELGAVWFGAGRYAVVDLWTDYLALRSGAIASDVDRAVLARTIVEIITTWAVKMPWDRAPRPYPADATAAVATMIRHLVTENSQ